MSGMVDKEGNELNTQQQDDGKTTGLPDGDEGKVPEQPQEPITEIKVEEGYFLLRIPVRNNLYQTLSSLLWAEDRIRGIYAEAQMNKARAQQKLISPVGRVIKSFKNKWS